MAVISVNSDPFIFYFFLLFFFFTAINTMNAWVELDPATKGDTCRKTNLAPTLLNL